MTTDNVGQKYAEIFCAARSRCCAAQGEPFTPALMEACIDEASFVPLKKAVGLSERVFNPEGARECLKGAARYDCTNRIMVEASCELVYTGRAQLGDPCELWNECEQAPNTPLICSELPPTTGTCVPGHWFQPLGATCGQDYLECDVAQGLWCNKGTCAAPSVSGASCGNAPPWECTGGTYCNQIAPATCVPTLPDGAPCTNGFACNAISQCLNGVCTAAPAGTCLN